MLVNLIVINNEKILIMQVPSCSKMIEKYNREDKNSIMACLTKVATIIEISCCISALVIIR